MEVAHPRVPVEELTGSLSSGSLLPEAVSEALGISLPELLDLYFGGIDKGRRDRLVWDAIDQHRMNEEDEVSRLREMDVDMPQAPSTCVDRSRPKLSDIYRSSTQNANATTLRTPKVDDILLSILTIATPGDHGLSHP
jgi:hypothetical protein